MNRTLVIRLGILGIFALMALWGWGEVKDDPALMFVYFIFVGTAVGLLAVKYLLPWFGDAVATVVYSSGEKIRADEGMKAAALVARGDYEGAIQEHEKALQNDPQQVFPVGEMAKICAEKLHDPARALALLEQHLAAHEWKEDDEAFLRFRIADLYAEHLHDLEKARELLLQIIADFPNTRHSANAHHRAQEVEQAQFKQIAAQRLKGAGPA